MRIDRRTFVYCLVGSDKKHKLLVIFLFITVYFLIIYSLQKRSITSITQNIQDTHTDQPFESSRDGEVLLLYVYARTHTHAYGNLEYFVQTAVRENDGVDYVFILQQVNNKTVNENDLPKLPKNALYIQHEHICFEFGTYGWFFDEYTIGNSYSNQTSIANIKKSSSKLRQRIDLRRYKYFIFMDSSIRGPFYPPYFIDHVLNANLNYYWYSIFTRRINDRVKLVGPTISCLPAPHVQTYLFATDFTGLSILLKPGTWGSTEKGIFACYPTGDHSVLNSQVPVSNRILLSNYFIDSLLTKYQTINFSDPRNHFCNNHINPIQDKMFDKTSLEPYEVVFVQYNDIPFARDAKDRAKTIETWITERNATNRTNW